MVLSAEDCAKTVALVEDERSQWYVARTGTNIRRPGCGGKRKTTAKDDQFLVLNTQRNRHSTSVETKNQLREVRGQFDEELTGNQAVDLHMIQNMLEVSKIDNDQNNIVALVIKEEEETKPKAAGAVNLQGETADNSILYSASSPLNNNLGAMLYSSEALLLQTNVTSVYLEEAVYTRFDNREEITRLITTIPFENGRITLRFKFTWLNDYWHFTLIEGLVKNKDNIIEFNLTPNRNIKAPRHVSFHCEEETVFTDLVNDVRLFLFNLRVQPDVQNHNQFDEAYDCSLNDHENRFKRKVEDESSSTTIETPYEEPTGDPILYSAAFPTSKDIEAMIYSSKPPLLKMNSSFINLGDATLSGIDVRNTYTRLNVLIPVENAKIWLRFKFPWLSSYWYLTSVEVQFISGADTKQYNLTLNQEITAPRHFSYHCGGQITFVDTENDIELNLYEVQAQPDAFRHRFSDAYNCVPFTTGPLWSGLFVAFILIVGLIFGLVALDNIKTMDKFDNHKTKQLSITVSE
ncbi:hypothetical protein ILUMI_10923 [Ignelater luminosus]|uniref:V-type proton ATPase subunit S1 n=1 Tax=Ignelater luminosus TaxID=2038154 RepID=A0A8K0CX03_IGNLU|nr:hypothetical protein ILUMI_10923 [Ignelater luminosus]